MKKTRLDTYLASNHREISRSEIKRKIVSGIVLVDGLPRKPSFLLKGGEKITYLRKSPPPPPAEPEPIPLTILHEDAEILVIDKPSGIIVHPAGKTRSGTLVNGLMWHFGQSGPTRLGLVHRLDKGTSGVMVVAKTDLSQRRIAAQFKNRQVEKCYWALVFGKFASRAGVIDFAIGRDTRHRRKFSSHSRYTRSAETHYRVLREFPLGKTILSLLEARPKTGRTHQIRVHLSERGHPIVGDTHYGAKSHLSSVHDEAVREVLDRLDRPFLHARSLSFTHPSTGAIVSYTVELPAGLQEIMDLLEGREDPSRLLRGLQPAEAPDDQRDAG